MTTDECDPIIVAESDDGVILSDSTDDSHVTQCEHCGHEFDVRETCGVFDGSRALYSCPECGRTTEGRQPGS